MMELSRLIPRCRFSSPGLPALAPLMRNVQLSMKLMRSWALDRGLNTLAMISARRTCSVGRPPRQENHFFRHPLFLDRWRRTNIVNFNQTPTGDFGDWLSEACPQRHPYVQNAFVCPDQFSDISATSPEGINLDVIGYDLVTASNPLFGNISTRAFVQTGDNVMIGGFIVQGTQPKRVILRAIGPELSHIRSSKCNGRSNIGTAQCQREL